MRAAVLLDGGFVTKRLEDQLGRFPGPDDIVSYSARILAHPRLLGSDLLRIYFYDAPPLGGARTNPVDGSRYDFGAHRAHALNQTVQEALAVTANFAVRRGETVFHGWKLRPKALRELASRRRALTANDLAPDVAQKGVDLRIGLDFATLAVKRIVDTIVLVSGDSDLVLETRMSEALASEGGARG